MVNIQPFYIFCLSQQLQRHFGFLKTNECIRINLSHKIMIDGATEPVQKQRDTDFVYVLINKRTGSIAFEFLPGMVMSSIFTCDIWQNFKCNTS